MFKRPGMAIDREVFSCHPPKIESMVRSIIESFKNHTRDSVPVWMEKQGKPFLVTYYAVRDKKDNYLGTVEVVQDQYRPPDHLFQNILFFLPLFSTLFFLFISLRCQFYPTPHRIFPFLFD